MKKTTKKAGKAKDSYTASVKIFGKVHEGVGATVLEAVANITTTKAAKGVCILTLSKGDLRKERVLTAPQTFRLFSGGRIMREIALKNISLLFGTL